MFDKPFPIFHNILMFMTINKHALLFLLILPAQLVQPSPCSMYMNSTCPGSWPLLDFWCCHIINNILCLYIPFFCNFCEMQLNVSLEVLILKDRRMICSVTMEWKLFVTKVIFNPPLEISCMFHTTPHGFSCKYWCFSPRVWELWIQVKV